MVFSAPDVSKGSSRIRSRRAFHRLLRAPTAYLCIHLFASASRITSIQNRSASSCASYKYLVALIPCASRTARHLNFLRCISPLINSGYHGRPRKRNLKVFLWKCRNIRRGHRLCAGPSGDPPGRETIKTYICSCCDDRLLTQLNGEKRCVLCTVLENYFFASSANDAFHWYDLRVREQETVSFCESEFIISDWVVSSGFVFE